MKKADITRVIWCHHCNGPQNHTIAFKGTFEKNNKKKVKFESECLTCRDNFAIHIINEHYKTIHTVLVSDYNALINVRLYDGVYAP